MKKQFRLGFTLVELLVVISIIGMLAGLLLPAVNAAREAGRRSVCMNNQSQLALAIINYDGAKGQMPQMRGVVGQALNADDEPIANVTSWIGFLLPYLEYNQLYLNLADVSINEDTTSPKYYEKQLIRMKTLLCPSSDQPLVAAGSHYVCNGGYQNAISDDRTDTESDIEYLDPAKIADAPFIDGWASKVKCSIDYISSHSGTGNVILLSENEREITDDFGSLWSHWDGTNTLSINSISHTLLVNAHQENRIAFCFPRNILIKNEEGDDDDYRIHSRLAEYGAETNWSYKGYDVLTASDGTGTKYALPSFLNKDKGLEISGYCNYRRARPSSNHPGVVLAAFADRSVRPINENMNKRTFVWLCQPHSGQVISGDAF